MPSTVHRRGTPVAVEGDFPQVGATARPFTLVGKDLSDVPLSSLGDARKVLNIFPSVDTGTCAASVRRFNQLAGELDDTVVLCISADLPFAQARFCGAEGLDSVITLSTLRGREFHTEYGVAIADGPLAGLTARAVLVLDGANRIIHAELVGDISSEPDYEAVLKVLAKI
ncbi:thiol peroxidase [Streptomyces sp. NPDC001828]|uniref:thiol peroxidase n=1 Tax=Streptomyces sp. NPDC001828 TaxID=3364615 RepID=UPI0036CA788C